MEHEQWLKLHDEWLELHNRAIAEHDAMMAESDLKHDRMREEHDRDIKMIRQMLRHAVRLAVQESRSERRKRRELDDKITQLASSHLLTEEALRDLKATVDRFIASLRGGNGSQQS